MRALGKILPSVVNNPRVPLQTAHRIRNNGDSVRQAAKVSGKTPNLLSHPILSSAPLSLSLTGMKVCTHEARRYLVSISEEIEGPEVLSASEKGAIKAYVETTFNGELTHTKKEITTYLETAVSLRLDFYGEDKQQISLYWILKSELRNLLDSSSTREALKKDGWTDSDFKKAFPNFFSKAL